LQSNHRLEKIPRAMMIPSNTDGLMQIPIERDGSTHCIAEEL
jgi:hypothetical protein